LLFDIFIVVVYLCSKFHAAVSQWIQDGSSGLHVPRRLKTLAGSYHQGSGL